MLRIIMILDSGRERSTNLKASSEKVRANGIANVNRLLSFSLHIPPANGSKGFSLSMSKHKNMLVTGATGFLGSHLAARLLDRGDHVTALARGSRSASARSRVEGVLRDVGVSQFENLNVLES